MSKPKTWQLKADEGNDLDMSRSTSNFGDEWSQGGRGKPLVKEAVVKKPQSFGSKVTNLGVSFLMGGCMGFFVGGSVGAIVTYQSGMKQHLRRNIKAAGIPFFFIFGFAGAVQQIENFAD